MNTEFDEIVGILQNKEWLFKQHVDDQITVGSQFVVTALMEESPSQYVVGLYGKTNPDSDDPIQWYTYKFDDLGEIYKLFEHIVFVADHNQMFTDLYSKLPLNDPSN